MRLASPLDAVSAAVHHAALIGLPNIVEQKHDLKASAALSPEDYQKAAKTNTHPTREVVRRPYVTECIVAAMFPQIWGSTALGFGGIGGAAMTPAYTVVVEGPLGNVAVYWGGHFAYGFNLNDITEIQRTNWAHDLAQKRTTSRRSAVAAYGIKSTK